MDIDFILEDSVTSCRPQWKLIKNLEEAGQVFLESVKQNYKTQEIERPAEPDEPDEDSSDGDDDDAAVLDAGDRNSSGDEADNEVCLTTLRKLPAC